jgi:hypothetical protein
MAGTVYPRFETLETNRGVVMMTRFLAGLLVAVMALAGTFEGAKADTISEEILTGGAPRGRLPGSLWGGSGGGHSPIPRTTVTYAGNHAPGTRAS